jgi:hypothetical protein
VRKYAGDLIPEIKLGEPTWANAVMSRRWEREETLERDKSEMLRKREAGITHEKPATCMTQKQDQAHRLVKDTFALMKKYKEKDVTDTTSRSELQ